MLGTRITCAQTIRLPQIGMMALLVLSGLCDFAEARTYNPQNDDPSFVADGETWISDLRELDQKAPSQTEAATIPWMPGPFAMSQGLIGQRVFDPAFIAKSGVVERYNYVRRSPLRVVELLKGEAKAKFISILSPAEKYDLLVGDLEGGLTRAIWKEVLEYKRSGNLVAWAGICEGGAAASVRLSEPVEPVRLQSAATEDMVEFSALDIKALGAMLWSGYTYKPAIVGGRCMHDEPARDDQGVITDESCADTNPASFHLALLNRLGVQKRHLIINRGEGVEVWNSPIVSYRVRYKNPLTGAVSARVEDAAVPYAQIGKDARARFRIPAPNYLVQIETAIEYGIGSQQSANGSHPIQRAGVTLSYDLELDVNYVPRGGEWYGDWHPDFYWIVSNGLSLLSVGELGLSDPFAPWRSPVFPREWFAARAESATHLQPLARVVNRLVELSRRYR